MSAPGRSNPRRRRSFSGVRAIDADDDSGEIVIRLDAPDRAFAETLALVAAAPVPPGTPARDQSADPPPGVGPYAITSADPETGFTLERSPNFADLDVPDIPTGNIERITTRIGGDPREQAEGVLDGEFDYTASQPPPEMRAEIATRAGERFAEHLTPPTYYAFSAARSPQRVRLPLRTDGSERLDLSPGVRRRLLQLAARAGRLRPLGDRGTEISHQR